MFKPIRIILVAAAGILLILILAVVAAFWYADSLARRGIEAGGTHALGVETSVQSVNVGLFRGTLTVDGLRIANPQNFDAPHFLTMSDGRTTVAIRSLRQDIIRIPQLHLTDVDVNLQRTADGRANYRAILDHLEQFSRPDTPDRAPDEPEQRLIINELILRNITINADLAGGAALPAGVGDMLPERGRITIPIPEIRLENVGRTGEGVGGTGVTISELAALLVEALLTAAVHHGGDLLPADMLNDLRGRLAEIGNIERLTGAFDEFTAELERARSPEEVRELIRDAPDRLRDLIPSDDDR